MNANVSVITTIAPPHGKSRTAKLARDAVAGCAAGVASAVFVCPLDVVKARMQFGALAHAPTAASALAAIWRAEGPRGWYRGLGATLSCYVPSWGIYFAIYRALRDPESLSPWAAPPGAAPPWAAPPWAAAAAAGVSSTLLTNPLWVVRSRIVARPTPQYPGFAAGLRALPRASYAAGLLPSLLGVSHVAIQLPLYEYLCAAAPTATAEPPPPPPPPTTTPATKPTRPAASVVLPAICGAKLVATTLTYPHEVIRTRMQNGQFATIAGCLKGLYVSAGNPRDFARIMYRGFGANFLRTMPSACVTFYTFEVVAHALRD